jgi:hypothetical protein
MLALTIGEWLGRIFGFFFFGAIAYFLLSISLGFFAQVYLALSSENKLIGWDHFGTYSFKKDPIGFLGAIAISIIFGLLSLLPGLVCLEWAFFGPSD